MVSSSWCHMASSGTKLIMSCQFPDSIQQLCFWLYLDNWSFFTIVPQHNTNISSLYHIFFIIPHTITSSSSFHTFYLYILYYYFIYIILFLLFISSLSPKPYIYSAESLGALIAEAFGYAANGEVIHSPCCVFGGEIEDLHLSKGGER